MATNTFDFAVLQQKADRVIHNADEAVRKWVDLVLAPAKDVPIQYYDKNGNLVQTTRPNLNKIYQQVLTNALNASTNTFYVDTQQGNDANSGTDWNNAFLTVEKAINSVPYGNIATIFIRGNIVLTSKVNITGKRIFLVADNYDTANQFATQTLTVDQNSDTYFLVSNGIGYLKIVGFDIHSVPNRNVTYHWSMMFKCVYGHFHLQIGEYSKPSNLQVDHPIMHLESGYGAINLYGQTLNTNPTTSTNLIERNGGSYFAYGEPGLIDNTGGIIVRPTHGWN